MDKVVEKLIDIISLLNQPSKVEVDDKGYIIDFGSEDSISYFEVEKRLIDILMVVDGAEKSNYEKALKELKQKKADLKDRWLSDEFVSLAEFTFLTGINRDMTDRYTALGSDRSLRFYQLKSGTKIYFKRSDWIEFQTYLKN